MDYQTALEAARAFRECARHLISVGLLEEAKPVLENAVKWDAEWKRLCDQQQNELYGNRALTRP